MSDPKFLIEFPLMSWERGTPQEQILDFVRTMKGNMAIQVGRGGFFDRGFDREAQAYVNAYETVEKHIVSMQKIWGTAFDIQLTRDKENT